MCWFGVWTSDIDVVLALPKTIADAISSSSFELPSLVALVQGLT